MTREGRITHVVLGKNGLIGKSLVKSFQNVNLSQLERTTYGNWWDESEVPTIKKFFNMLMRNSDFLQVYVGIGVLSPNEDPSLIKNVNERIPINIARALEDLDSNLVTFGTIHEVFEMSNTYIDSKRVLADWLSSNVPENRHTHYRLHTLYDDNYPKAFMFLGSLYDCVTKGTSLKMSSGRQLREFHHVDDDVQAINFLGNMNATGILNLNHGRIISLFKLASEVKEQFPDSGHIEAGYFPDPPRENYETSFQPVMPDNSIQFREEISSIVNTFRKLSC